MSKIKNYYHEEISKVDTPEPDLSEIEGYDEEMKRQSEKDDKSFIAAMEKLGLSADEFNRGMF